MSYFETSDDGRGVKFSFSMGGQIGVTVSTLDGKDILLNERGLGGQAGVDAARANALRIIGERRAEFDVALQAAHKERT